MEELAVGPDGGDVEDAVGVELERVDPGLDGGGHLVAAVGDAADVAVGEPGGPAPSRRGRRRRRRARPRRCRSAGGSAPLSRSTWRIWSPSMLATQIVSPCTVMPVDRLGRRLVLERLGRRGGGGGAASVVVGGGARADPPSEPPSDGAAARQERQHRHQAQPQFASSRRRYGAASPTGGGPDEILDLSGSLGLPSPRTQPRPARPLQVRVGFASRSPLGSPFAVVQRAGSQKWLIEASRPATAIHRVITTC